MQAPVRDPELLRDATESRGVGGTALAAVHPADTAEVASVVRWAARQGVGVVPRGGGTGYSGGAVPADGELVLALGRLSGAGEVAPEAWTGSFPAGVTTAEVQRRSLEAGLFFAPNPGSQESSQIGGNVATNAGGPRSLRFGSVRSWVSGLEVVTPDGEVVRLGHGVRKDVETLDLLGLFTGSEGALGVITDVTLKLQPAPERFLPTLAVYPDRETGLQALRYAMASGVVPVALEYLDEGALLAATGRFPGGLPDGARFAVIAETCGTEEVARLESATLAEALGEDALAVRTPQERGEVERLWAWRSGVSLAVVARRGGKLSEDLVVPTDRLGEALEAVDRVGEEHGVEVTSWGHAGDGNLHATILVDRDDAGSLAHAAETAEAFFPIATGLGGALSGEHGVGTIKREAAAGLDPGVLRLQRRVKDALDPRGLMNPGKKLPPAAEP